jgi:hypothetical protein
MSLVALIYQGETFTVTAHHLVSQCSLFNDNASLLTAPYTIRSSIPLPLFRDFVAALEDKPIEINRENVAGLSFLCAEFGFRSLAAELADVRGSSAFRWFLASTPPPPAVPVTPGSTLSPEWLGSLLGSNALARESLSQFGGAVLRDPFAFVVAGEVVVREVSEAAALLPAVRELLSADACARMLFFGGFALSDSLSSQKPPGESLSFLAVSDRAARRKIGQKTPAHILPSVLRRPRICGLKPGNSLFASGGGRLLSAIIASIIPFVGKMSDFHTKVGDRGRSPTSATDGLYPSKKSV